MRIRLEIAEKGALTKNQSNKEEGRTMRRGLYSVFAPLILVALLVSTGCSTLETVGTGALLGGGTGAIIGHQSGETAAGAGIGAAVGALGGYIVSNEKEKRDIRTGIATANTLVVNVPSSDGQTFKEVVLYRHPNGWQALGGEIFPTPPTSEQLRERGYGPK